MKGKSAKSEKSAKTNQPPTPVEPKQSTQSVRLASHVIEPPRWGGKHEPLGDGGYRANTNALRRTERVVRTVFLNAVSVPFASRSGYNQ